MKTFGFILFVLVTAGVAVTSTLLASRYLALEKQLSEVTDHLERTQNERKRQEEEKMALRLESQRVQVDLEARMAEQKSQIDECAGLHQRDMQELLGAIGGINKRLTDVLVNAAPTSKPEEQSPDEAGSPAESAKPAKTGKPGNTGDAGKAEGPSRAVDVPHGAILTPEQEARKLQKAQ